MEHISNVIGFDMVCKAVDCIYNDHPVCMGHTESRPVIIGLRGQCLRYEKKEVPGASES